jgi:hypothetical protein
MSKELNSTDAPRFHQNEAGSIKRGGAKANDRLVPSSRYVIKTYLPEKLAHPERTPEACLECGRLQDGFARILWHHQLPRDKTVGGCEVDRG